MLDLGRVRETHQGAVPPTHWCISRTLQSSSGTAYTCRVAVEFAVTPDGERRAVGPGRSIASKASDQGGFRSTELSGEMVHLLERNVSNDDVCVPDGCRPQQPRRRPREGLRQP